MFVPPGFPISLMSAGDVWVVNSGANEVQPSMVAYANYANGLVTFAAGTSGGATSATVATSAIAPVTTPAGTGYIVGNVLTVVTSTGTALYPGTVLTGTGVATGTQIVSQISGTTGGVGSYNVDAPEQTAGSASAPITFAGSYGLLTMGAAPSATFTPGDVLTGSGVAPGTVLWQLLTGSGSGSTWVVSPAQTVASTTIANAVNIATKWVAMSYAAPGELVKMSSWPLG
jgi:hypothetical protein